MTLDERLQRAVDALGEKFNEKFRDELTRELQSLSEDLKAQAQPAAAPPPPPPPADNSAILRLADAIRALDTAPSLSDVLNTLATAAANESARAGVFVIREGELRSVKLHEFPARYEGAPIALPLSEAGVLNDAITQHVIATSATSPFDELPPDVNAIAIPLVLAGTSVGALYVEGADVPTMEILARFASRALEALTAMKTARAIAEGV
jgi:GAF domain-containing protein